MRGSRSPPRSSRPRPSPRRPARACPRSRARIRRLLQRGASPRSWRWRGSLARCPQPPSRPRAAPSDGGWERRNRVRTCPLLPDHQAAYGHTTQLHLELARAGLDCKRERSSLAYRKLVAGDAAEDGRDTLEGWLGLGDANSALILDYPWGSLVRRVVADASNPGFSLAGVGSEAAGSQCDPQA